MNQQQILTKIEQEGSVSRRQLLRDNFMPNAAKAVGNTLAALKREGKVVAEKQPDGDTVYRLADGGIE